MATEADGLIIEESSSKETVRAILREIFAVDVVAKNAGTFAILNFDI